MVCNPANEGSSILIPICSLSVTLRNITFSLGNYIEIDTGWATMKGYLPARDEIISYLDGTKFNLDRVIPYKTSSNRERELYLLDIK